jgi:surface protein
MDMSIIAGARLKERPFKYAANGVTVVLKAGRGAGVTGQVDGDSSGKIYTAVNETQLRAMDVDTDDFTSVCTTLVTNMSNMFSLASSFNQDINSWDVSSVTDMTNMFNNANSFNQPLNSWDVSSVNSIRNMFFEANSFNQPLNSWDVSSVTNMVGVFLDATSFNQPLNNWDVSNVTNMNLMFAIAEAFNQDISNWCVTNIASEPNSFDTGADAWVLSNSRPIWGTCP